MQNLIFSSFIPSIFTSFFGKSIIVWTAKPGPDYSTSFFADFYRKNFPVDETKSLVVLFNELGEFDYNSNF